MSMNMKRRLMAAGALVMTTGLSLLPVMQPLAAVGADQAEATEILEGNIIDTGRKGSLTLYKYDMTSAEEAGAYEMGRYPATGQQDSRVEKALEGYGIEGVQFSYLRVGDVETRHEGSRGTEVELVYELPAELADVLELKAADAVNMKADREPCSKAGVYHYTSEQISGALADLLEADNTAAKNALEDYLYSYGQIGSSADGQTRAGVHNMKKTDVNGYTSVDDLDLGLYLVVETEVPEMVTSTVNPWFVQLPFTNVGENGGERWLYDMTCYPKNQTGYPTLDKSVRTAAEEGDTKEASYDDTTSASMGDTLDYILVSRLPHITSQATYLSRYTFVDRLSAGLTYGRDARIAFYHDAESAAENRIQAADLIWEEGSGYFSASYEKAGKETQLTVSLTEAGLKMINGADNAGSGLSDCYLVVYYTAQVNSDAAVVLGDNGNPNDVQLVWSRTSDGWYETLEDRNYVYTYGLDLTKEFSDQDGDFSKVQFRLFNETDGRYVIAEQKEDGVYAVTGDTIESSAATVLVPHKTQGTLRIDGIEADSYELTEIATDDGYSLLKKPIRILVTSTDREILPAVIRSSGKTEMSVGAVEPASAEIDRAGSEMTPDGDSDDARVPMKVTNSKGFLLPQTGGSGLYAVTILGVITAAAGFLLTVRRRHD